ncbi:MAG: hypothetical protein WBC22_11350 [Sedimentisphaerales bacterium]
MTEELEQKLNELLGLKKQLEEVTEEKQKTVAAPVLEQYKKEARTARIRFWIGLVIGIVFIELGVMALTATELRVMGYDVLTGPFKFVLIGIGILGLYIPLAAKLAYRISQSKLSILQEMKQFELRITEMLKK